MKATKELLSIFKHSSRVPAEIKISFKQCLSRKDFNDTLDDFANAASLIRMWSEFTESNQEYSFIPQARTSVRIDGAEVLFGALTADKGSINSIRTISRCHEYVELYFIVDANSLDSQVRQGIGIFLAECSEPVEWISLRNAAVLPSEISAIYRTNKVENITAVVDIEFVRQLKAKYRSEFVELEKPRSGVAEVCISRN